VGTWSGVAKHKGHVPGQPDQWHDGGRVLVVCGRQRPTRQGVRVELWRRVEAEAVGDLTWSRVWGFRVVAAWDRSVRVG
jgi:hypothetical protein